jgi:hypothetical protein
MGHLAGLCSKTLQKLPSSSKNHMFYIVIYLHCFIRPHKTIQIFLFLHLHLHWVQVPNHLQAQHWFTRKASYWSTSIGAPYPSFGWSIGIMWHIWGCKLGLTWYIVRKSLAIDVAATLHQWGPIS